MLLLLLLSFVQCYSFEIQYLNYTEDLKEYITQNDKKFDIYLSNSKMVYDVSLSIDDIQQQAVKLSNSGDGSQIRYNTSNSTGCQPIQSYLSASQFEQLSYSEPILGSLLIPELRTLFLVTPTSLLPILLTFDDRYLSFAETQQGMKKRMTGVKYLNKTSLNAHNEKKFFMVYDSNLKLVYIVGQNSSYQFNYTNILDGGNIDFKELKLNFEFQMNFCEYIKDFSSLVCASAQHLHQYQIKDGVAVEMQRLNSVDFQSTEKLTITNLISSSYDANQFFVIEKSTGVYQFAIQQVGIIKVKTIYFGKDIKDYSRNIWGETVVTENSIINYINGEKRDQLLLNGAESTQGQYTKLYLDNFHQVLLTDGVHRINRANEIQSLNLNIETYIHHRDAKQIFKLMEFNTFTYFVTVSSNVLIIHEIEHINGHIQCHFLDDDKVTYTMKIVSRDCERKAFNITYTPLYACVTTKPIIVRSETTYVNSDRTALAVGLSLGLLIFFLLAAFVLYLLYQNWQKTVSSLQNFKRQRSLSFQPNRLEDHSEEQIIPRE